MERYLTPLEAQQLLNAARRVNDPLAQRDYHCMSALKLTGMRITEFSLVTVGDVLSALRTQYLYIPKEHRKGKRRDHKVFVTTGLREHLLALLNVRRQMGFADTVEAPLVMSREGRRLSVRSYQSRVKHWALLAGLTVDVSPHWFRHTRGMDIMRSSEAADPRGVAKAALGHASIASTGIYTEPAREDVEQALEALDGGKKRLTLAQLRRLNKRRSA